MKVLKVSITLIILTVVGCGKKEEAGGNSYYASNGMCFQRSNNKRVNKDKCDSVPYFMAQNRCFDQHRDSVDMSKCLSQVGRYFFLGGTCRDKQNNLRQVNPRNCETNRNNSHYGYNDYYGDDGNYGGNYDYNYNNPYRMNGQPGCFGPHYFVFLGFYSEIYCEGFTCRGLTLYEAGTGRKVFCQ